MIALPTGTQIWLAAGVTDLWRGFTGLSATIQTALKENPFSGHVFAFRGRRGDLIKLLWWDGDGLCLFSKRLERGRFVWPQATDGTVLPTRAQLSMLLEGIDWRNPRGDIRRVNFNQMLSSPSGFAYGGYDTGDTLGVGTASRASVNVGRQGGTNFATSTTDSLNRTTKYTCNALGNVTSITRLAGTPNAVTTAFTSRFNV